jgi:hypothetical protein
MKSTAIRRHVSSSNAGDSAYGPAQMASGGKRRIVARMPNEHAGPRDADNGVRLAAAQLEADSFREKLQAQSNEGRAIAFADVVQLGAWSALADAADGPKSNVGKEWGGRLLDTFVRQHTDDGTQPPRVAIFPIGGVCLLPSGYFRMMLVTSAIKFDYSLALPPLDRIDHISDESLEWWLPKARRRGPAAGRRVGRGITTQDPTTPLPATSGELARHQDRAYGLATFTLAAIHLENRIHLHTGPGETPHPTRRFERAMTVCDSRIGRAEQLLDEAIQRTTQTRYGVGMAFGTVMLAISASCAAAVAQGFDLSRSYPLGFAAGGLGAVVSVLQRMTTKKGLQIVGRDRQLIWFGAVRALVGGVFGILVVALLQARLLNIQTGPRASPLALYGSLAFFAGFNERFAQDALALPGVVLPGAPSAQDADRPASSE